MTAPAVISDGSNRPGRYRGPERAARIAIVAATDSGESLNPAASPRRRIQIPPGTAVAERGVATPLQLTSAFLLRRNLAICFRNRPGVSGGPGCSSASAQAAPSSRKYASRRIVKPPGLAGADAPSATR